MTRGSVLLLKSTITNNYSVKVRFTKGITSVKYHVHMKCIQAQCCTFYKIYKKSCTSRYNTEYAALGLMNGCQCITVLKRFEASYPYFVPMMFLSVFT